MKAIAPMHFRQTKILQSLFKLAFLLPFLMVLVGVSRLPFAQLIARHLPSNTIRFVPTASVHTRARQTPYPGARDVQRTPVSDEKVPWNVSWPDYTPTEYTAPKVLKKPSWADDANVTKIEHFNAMDGDIDRKSFMGKYEIDEQSGRPRNPQGRTGLSGRGLLGRWGPNHAGDPVVTRWVTGHSDKKQKVLEIILINRNDNGDLALPGGMVDPGESAVDTVKREFVEEAMNTDDRDDTKVDELFKNAESIYQGYIDDPRNTDNAWMESEALNAHDKTGALTKDLKLKAGDDAAGVQWVPLDRERKLYASHEVIIQKVVRKHGAFEYWHDEHNRPASTTGQGTKAE